MRYDINKDLFRKFSPENKLNIIKSFTVNELNGITFDTIRRMLKEAGSRIIPNKVFKKLRLNTTNNWNSRVCSIEECNRKDIILELYIQGEDTDRSTYLNLRDFLKDINYDSSLGEFTEEYLHGTPSIIRARYSKEDKSNIIRNICEQYVKCKYNIHG